MEEEFGERIAKLSRLIKSKEAEKAKVEAGIELEKDRLAKEFGVSDIKEARAKLKEWEKEIISLEEKLEEETLLLEKEIGDG